MFKVPSVPSVSSTPKPQRSQWKSISHEEDQENLPFPVDFSKSTGFIRRSMANRQSGSQKVPSTPTKPSLHYYSSRTNSETLHFIYPELITDNMYTGSYFDYTFSVVSTLDGGGFADVFLVRKRPFDQVYCIKKTRHKFTGYNDRALKCKEVEVLSKLCPHPNICNMICAWIQSGYLYIQSDFYSGGSLSHFLDFHDVNYGFVLQLLEDLVMGLYHIHSNGILHLDLKPSNILFENNPRLKFVIGDFGLATFSIDLKSIENEGDRSYLAPEILEGIYGKHNDIFSMGLMVLEVITGCTLPETGDAWIRLREGNFDDVPTMKPEFVEVYRLVKDMLNPDYQRRITINQIMLDPLIAPRIFCRLGNINK